MKRLEQWMTRPLNGFEMTIVRTVAWCTFFVGCYHLVNDISAMLK